MCLPLEYFLTLLSFILCVVFKTYWAQPIFKPGTTRTQSEYHTPRPLSHIFQDIIFRKIAIKISISISQALVVQWQNARLPRGRPGFDSRPMQLFQSSLCSLLSHKEIQRGWDSNPRGETPMDQQSIALTTRPPRHTYLHCYIKQCFIQCSVHIKNDYLFCETRTRNV